MWNDSRCCGLSLAQEAIYFDQLRQGDSPLYNIGGYIVCHDIDVQRLRQAHQNVIEHNEMFFVSFEQQDGKLEQRFQNTPAIDLPLVDFSSTASPELEAQQWLQTQFHQPIPLLGKILFKAWLVKLSARQYWYVGLAHHMIIDGWGFSSWALQLSKCYASESVTVEPLQVSYVNSELTYRESPKYEKDKAYWQSQLQALPAPFLYPRYNLDEVAEQGTSKRLVASLDKTVVEAMADVARRLDTGLPQLFLAVLAHLIGRLYGQNSLAIGVPLHNRAGAAQKKAVGVFTNVSVQHITLDEDAHLTDLLTQIVQQQRSMLRHKKLPVAHVAAELGHTDALYDIVFNYLKLDYSELSFDNRPASIFYQSHDHEVLPLSVNVWDGNRDDIEIQFDYHLGYFSATEIMALSERLLMLCTQLQDHIDTALHAWPLLLAEEATGLQAEASAQCIDYDNTLCIHELFERRVAQSPGSVAVHWNEQTLSYAQLNHRANQLAHYLSAHLTEQFSGCADPLIGVYFERSADMVVAILAILKAGAAYIPLDPNYPSQRLFDILQDARPLTVLTSSALQETQPLGVDCIATDSLSLSGYSKENVACRHADVTARDLAYVMYTSGSTGRPKGVMVEHQNLVNYQLNVASRYRISAQDRVLQFSSMSFDIFVEELFGALCHGASLVLRNDACMSGAEHFWAFCNEYQITVVSLPTAFWTQINEQSDQPELPWLRCIIVGGEALSAAAVTRFFTQQPKIELINSYGPTEATVTASGVSLQPNAPLTIGGANPNTALWVLDEQHRLVPNGVVGELYIGGDGVARGYLNNPEATAASFLTVSTLTTNAAQNTRLYKTGDLVRRLDNGQLEFIGRVDQQVKIQGYRVEPAEISYQLNLLAEVESSLVVANPTKQGGIELLAYIKPHLTSETPTLDLIALRAQLQGVLPHYLIPAEFIEVMKWPLNENGKIDKVKLRQHKAKANIVAFQAPRSALEIEVVNILARVLSKPAETISLQDNFFALGGQSLLAIELANQIRQQLNIELPVRHIFASENLLALTKTIAEHSDAVSELHIQPQPKRGLALELSSSERRLWLVDRLQDSSSEYNMCAAFSIDSSIRIEVLEQVFEAIIERHEPLRSVYFEIKSEVKRIVKRDWQFDIQYDEIAYNSDHERKQKLQALLAEEENHVFNLQSDLLLRVRYVKTQNASDPAILLCNLHHIAADGISMQVMQDEFQQLYHAFAQGLPSPLAPLPIQYSDYAVWQRERLASGALDKHIAYWETKLAAVPDLHALPLDYSRPEVAEHRGKVLSFQLSRQQTQQLTALANRYQLTPFMLAHGMLALVLSRHSNSHDIVMGAPQVNRPMAELEHLVGFFVNTGVLRLNTAVATLGAFFNEVRETHFGAQEHQGVPFDYLVEKLQVSRSQSYAPLVQIMLNPDGLSKFSLDGSDLFKPLDIEPTKAKFDLTIDIDFADTGFDCRWLYDQALFAEQSIVQLMSHCERLICSLLSLSEQYDSLEEVALAELQMFSAHEHDMLLDRQQSPQSETPLEQDYTLHQLFESVAHTHPDRVAVSMGEESLSYRALDQAADQLAGYLIATESLSAGSLIGICMDRSPAMFSAILAVLKAGVGYLPLDPDYPQERLQYMIADAQPQLILSDHAVMSALDLPGKVIDIEALNLSSEHCLNVQQQSPLDAAKQLAYVIYTSGSTGRPKGVMVAHKGIVNIALNQQQQLTLTPTSKVLQFASASFDASVWDWVMALTCGAELVICPAEVRYDVATLQAFLAEQGITHVTLPPSLLRLMSPQQDLTLETIVVAGESVSQGCVDTWGGVCKLFNGYGPSETSICATMGRLYPQQNVHIGSALNGMSALVLQDDLQLLPCNVTGELYIGGVGMAMGYLNQPELTAERFIANPYYSKQHANSSPVLYKTGDLVRRLPDGKLVFVGRTDSQIQVRGHRVELSEIEQVIAAQPRVAASLVIQDKAAEQSSRLIAYYELSEEVEGQGMEAAFLPQLRANLLRILPDYMMPGVFIQVSEWPLNANGKIDKTQLPQSQGAMKTSNYVPPDNALERQLVTIWSELMQLDCDEISVTAHFFELGGHSLMAVQMAKMIEQELSVIVAVKEIFQYEDIRRLAAHIDSLETMQRVVIKPVEQASRFLPVSYSQRRLWVIDQLQGGSPEYNMFAALRVDASFDADVLEHAITEIIARHQVLRSNFVEHAGETRQLVQQSFKFTLQRYDLSSQSEQAQQQGLRAMIAEQANYVFRLESDLMIRACFVAMSDRDHAPGVVLFNMHHIASDGWSMEVFKHELATLYQAFKAGQESPLPELTIQYSDYAHWERSWHDGDALETQSAYWRSKLSDASFYHALPLDFTRPAVKGHDGGLVSGRLGGELARALRKVEKQLRLTRFMLFHSVLAMVLARHANSDEILIGTPVANRGQSETEELIGYFVNTLVLRVNTVHPSLHSYFEHVKDTHLQAQDNQHVPFEQLVELLDVPRSSSYSPVVQIMLTIDNEFRHVGSTDDWAQAELFEVLPNDVHHTKFDLEVEVIQDGEDLVTNWTFDTALFTPQRVTQWQQHFLTVLETLARLADSHQLDTSCHPSSLNMLSDAELTASREVLSGASSPMDSQLTMHTLIEQQARLHGDKTAIIFADTELSYAELDARAEQLAYYLIAEHQIKVQDKVAILLDRSEWVVIAMLAVLKAGATYVPMDPNYPGERLTHILTDAAPVLVLTEPKHTQILPRDLAWQALSAVDLTPYSHLQVSTAMPLVDADALAYVIYTSGSTGKPKGVMVSHGSLVQSTLARHQVYPELSTFMLLSSFAFDSSVAGLYSALSCGARLLICSDEAQQNLDYLTTIMARYAVSHFLVVPSFYAAMLEHLDSTSLPNLSAAIVAGEECLPSLVEKHYQYFGEQSVDLFNEYGPTEATVWATVDRLQPSQPITIGRAIANCQLYVLSPDGGQLPLGSAGELYIGGDGLAQGYLGQPALSAEKFIANPFYDPRLRNASARLYRTGDMVRALDDGRLLFIGRSDDQVKIRGFRVELAEVAHHINMLDVVDACVVLVHQDRGGHKRLIAYVKAAASCTLTEQALTQRVPQLLAARLPDYMIPATVIAVAQWPVTANGKVDKKALPAPSETLVGAAYQAPQTEIESVLQKLWAELLQLDCEQVSTTANFFELGGDSILSIQLVSRAAKAGLHFSARALFEAQTISQLAPQVQSQAERLAEQGPVSGLQPLLPIQQQLFADSTDVHHFNQAVLLTPALPLSQSHLISLVAALYGRHDALSVRYQPNDAGQWQGEYTPQRDELALARDSVSSLDLSGLSEAQYQAQMDQLQASFVLSQGRLLQAVQVRLPAQLAQGENDERLLLMIHHLAVDGVSWRILLEDLALGLQQLQRSASLTLAAKTSSYQQWGTFLADHAHTEAVQQQRDYWLEVLSTSEPTLAERYGATQEMAGTAPGQQQQLNFSLSAAQTEQLLGPCQRSYRSTTLELLLAAILSGFERFDGTRSVCLDLEGHGRESDTTQLDLSQTVGWFTAIYPLRLSCEGNTPGALLNGVKRQYRAIPNKGMDFALLQHSDGVLAALPAREIVFNYLGQFDQINHDELPFSVAEEYSGQTISTARTPWHGVTLTTLVSQGQLHFSLSYAEAGYDGAAMAELLFHIEQGLADLIAHCMGTQQGEYTQVDFPLATAEEASIRQWQAQYGEIQDLYPATGMQQGLLFHSMLAAGSYVTQMTLDFSGVDKSRLAEAWRQVVARHDILRSVFVGLDSAAAHQLVLPDMPLAWREYDLSEWSAEAQADEIERLREEIKVGGFDAGSGPLMSLVLIELGGGQQRLLWSHHHAILDGWCLPIIFAELTAFYQGEGARLAAPQPYRHYAAYLAQQDGEVAQAYWRDVLAEVEHKTPLPLAHQRAEQRAQEPAMQARTVTFSEEQTGALSAFAKRSQTTVNILVQGAWALLLSKYGGGSQVVFGSTTSGRPATLTGVDEMVGLFINTLPVVAKVEGETPVVSWLQQLHRTQQASEEYSHVPLHTLQQLAGMNAGLFDTLVIFENYPVDTLLSEKAKAAALKVTNVEGYEGTNYAITLKAHIEASLSIGCEVQGVIFDDAALESMLGHLHNLLMALTQSDATTTLAELTMLSDSELQTTLSSLAGAQPQQQEVQCIHARFEQHAATVGERTALICGSERLSYAALNRRANQLADYLLSHGLAQPGRLLGVCVQRSVELVVGILASLKAGCAYVPLDPAYPRARMAYLVEDAALEVILTDSEAQGQFEAGAVQALALDKLDCSAYSSENPDRTALGLSADALAYVIYTSGSTGQPKGVMIEHRSLDNYVQALAPYCQDVAGSYVNTNICFDGTATSFWLPLCMGKYLKLSTYSDAASLDELADEVFNATEPQLFKITPAHLDALIYRDAGSVTLPRHTMFIGGEALLQSKYWQLPEALRAVQIFNHYGPSEATVGCAINHIAERQLAEAKSIPIGQAIDNVSVAVVDCLGQVCAPGVIGELYVSGTGIARGYLHNPALTSERFITTTMLSFDGNVQRWYKTGDLVRSLPSGQLEFIGRVDEQIKIRGHRVELGEVQHHIADAAGVESALVVARESAEQGHELVAYVKLQPELDAEQVMTELTANMAATLPYYMLPGEYAWVESWPLTSNGKIDKRALQNSALFKLQEEYIAPFTETEQRLVEIWSELLGTEASELSVTASFFNVGGHSLSSIRMVSLVEQRLGIKPTLEQVFAHSSIRALAALIEPQIKRRALEQSLQEQEDIQEFSV